MKHNGALLCLVIGLAVAKAISISGSVGVNRTGASAAASLIFPRIPGFSVPFANLFGLRTTTRAATTTESNTSGTASSVTTPSSVTSSSSNSGTSSATTQSGNGGSSSSTTQSSNSGTSSGTTQSSNGSSSSNGGSSSGTTQSSNDGSSSGTTQSSNGGSSNSTTQSSNSGTSSGTTQSSNGSSSSNGGSSTGATQSSNDGSSSGTTQSSNDGSSSGTTQSSNDVSSSGTTQSSNDSSSSNAPASNEDSSTTSSNTNNVRPSSPRTSGLLSLFNIPSVASMMSDLSSNGGSSNMKMPTIPGLDTIAAMASGPAVSTALKEAEDHMAEALSISGNLTIGLDQAVQDALAGGDPTAALGDIAQAILDAYLSVAANCPVIAVGARVLQEGIRLAFEVVQSAENVMFGTTSAVAA